MKAKESVILAFDYGLRRIGVAVGHTMLKTSTPLTILAANEGVPNWQDVEKLITEWNPAQLVVGEPLNMDGTDSEMAARARRFSRRLAERFKLPCELIDERLSSEEASELLQSGDRPRIGLDAAAAQVILQTWMNQRP